MKGWPSDGKGKKQHLLQEDDEISLMHTELQGAAILLGGDMGKQGERS